MGTKETEKNGSCRATRPLRNAKVRKWGETGTRDSTPLSYCYFKFLKACSDTQDAHLPKLFSGSHRSRARNVRRRLRTVSARRAVSRRLYTRISGVPHGTNINLFYFWCGVTKLLRSLTASANTSPVTRVDIVAVGG